MAKIAIVVVYDIVPGKEAEFSVLIREHARLTRQEEKGCLRFEVYEPLSLGELTKIPGRMMVSEQYADGAALEVHNANPRVPGLREKFKVLLQDRQVSIAEMVQD
jgi:quinol monooxygenase YgiN